MKKISLVICIIFLSVFVANTVFAQVKNTSAYFLLDTDLATSGYQGMSDVLDIGGRIKVGFGIYAKQWENSKGFTVRFEWDGTKAEYRSGDSATDIVDDDITVNGAEITLAKETNILAASLISAGETSEAGLYTNSFAQGGAVDASTAAEGLIYLAVFRTVDGFTTTDQLTITASVTVADEDGNPRFLGIRYFYVNKSVDVKPATWKEVKEQFKDF